MVIIMDKKQEEIIRERYRKRGYTSQQIERVFEILIKKGS